MFGLLLALLVLVLQLDVYLHLVLDGLVPLTEGPLQVVECLLLDVDLVAQSPVLVLVPPQFLLQLVVEIAQLVYVRLHLDQLVVYLRGTQLVVPHPLCQLPNLVVGLVLVGLQSELLVYQFLVVGVQDQSLFLQLLDLDHL